MTDFGVSQRGAKTTLYKLFPWLREAWASGRQITQPLKAVPAGAVVMVVLAHPDNRAGQFSGLILHPVPSDVQDARQEITDMARRFIDEVLPLPD